MEQKVHSLTPEEFESSNETIFHLTVLTGEFNRKTYKHSKIIKPNSKTRKLLTLDMSRLDLDDSDLRMQFYYGNFERLVWLDLAANPEITKVGVEYIADAIDQGKMPNLRHLDLLGTSFDATPYLDSPQWRMTNLARDMIPIYGYQRWMMLGSQKPEEENKELLTDAEIERSGSRWAHV